jgi:hypothetical protein
MASVERRADFLVSFQDQDKRLQLPAMLQNIEGNFYGI